MLDLLIFAFALTSCKKEEVNNNGNNNGEIENPGGQQAFSLQILSPHKLKATPAHRWLCEGNADIQCGRDESRPYNSEYAFTLQTTVTDSDAV